MMLAIEAMKRADKSMGKFGYAGSKLHNRGHATYGAFVVGQQAGSTIQVTVPEVSSTDDQ